MLKTLDDRLRAFAFECLSAVGLRCISGTMRVLPMTQEIRIARTSRVVKFCVAGVQLATVEEILMRERPETVSLFK